MKRLLAIALTAVLITPYTCWAAKSEPSLKSKVLLTIKVNKYVFESGDEINLAVSIKPQDREINDFRTTVTVNDYSGKLIFERTFYEASLSKPLTYKIQRNTYDFTEGGYLVEVTASSNQKPITTKKTGFGIIDKKQKLNLVLIINIAAKPLLDLEGVLTGSAESTINRLLGFIKKPLPKKFYYSISPLLIEDLKSLSSGYSKKSLGKTASFSSDDTLAVKAKNLLDKMLKIKKAYNFFSQTYSVADISRAPAKEIDWQLVSANRSPFLTNSKPSKQLVSSTPSSKIVFFTDTFTFARRGNKQLLGANPKASEAISDFSQTGLQLFFTQCSQRLAQNEKDIVIIATGALSLSFMKNLNRAIKKTAILKISKLPKGKSRYRMIDINKTKPKKEELFLMLEQFELISVNENKQLKKIKNNYLKMTHRLQESDNKILRSHFKQQLLKQFKQFSIKPEQVTLTGSKGKVPVGIFSEADYDAKLKVKIQSDDFGTPKELELKVKPKENTLIIPVKAYYGGSRRLTVMLYAGKRQICKEAIPVNVIMPSTISKYVYLILAVIIILIVGAFIFREKRNKKVGSKS